MIKNQKGDALTLAMGAAVFVGISIMVLLAVISNMDGKVNRARMVNDVEAIMMNVGQILSNRDLCAHALRKVDGTSVVFDPLVPAALNRFDIQRLYMAQGVPWNVPVPAGNNPVYCWSGDPDLNCPTLPPNLRIRDMSFQFMNDSTGNKIVYYKGSTGRYQLLAGNLVVDTDFTAGSVLGGDLNLRTLPLQILIDTVAPNAGHIELCFTRESPALICGQLGGSLDPITGTCRDMFGMCGVPPNIPPTCGSFPNSICSDPRLHWTAIYYAKTVSPGMQIHCGCQYLCAPN